MPSIQGVPGVGEIYLCTSVPIPDDSDSYHVVGFEPMAQMTNVHHMLLFACDTPGLPSTDGQQVCYLPRGNAINESDIFIFFRFLI